MMGFPHGPEPQSFRDVLVVSGGFATSLIRLMIIARPSADNLLHTCLSSGDKLEYMFGGRRVTKRISHRLSHVKVISLSMK